MSVKLNKIIIELDENSHKEFMELLEDYVTNHGARMKRKDFTFLCQLLEMLGFGWQQQDSFIATCQERKKDSIDWHLGACEEDGIKRMQFPKNDEDLRKILLEFDNHWTGEGYYK